MISTGFRISREWEWYQYETKWENNKIVSNRKVSKKKLHMTTE